MESWVPRSQVILVVALLCLAPQVRTDKTGSTCDETGSCSPPSWNLLEDASNAYRTVVTDTTCGNGTNGTTYQAAPIFANPTVYTCDNADPHPVSNILDNDTFTFDGLGPMNIPKLNTYWQSENTVDANGDPARRENLIINFTDTFLLWNIKLLFATPFAFNKTVDNYDMRPNATVFEKYTNDGQYTPLRSVPLNRLNATCGRTM